ncbi:MAG: glycoside hydrolase family 43 protein [Myxococcota bacterium]
MIGWWLGCSAGDPQVRVPPSAEAPTGETGAPTDPTPPSPPSSSTTAPTTSEPARVPVEYANPVFAEDLPDPFVLPIDGAYLAFGTNTGWANVAVARSIDLAEWDRVGDALPELPAWAVSGASLTWAPGVLDRGDGTWVLYFTARDRSRGRQCVGAATATAPDGPYVDALGAPLVCQDALGGSIDPYPFTDVDGARYLLWKNDGNCCGLDVVLWSQPLTDDGLGLLAAPSELIRHDRAWEDPLIENPAMVRGDDGTLHLLYSANWWESASYAVGAAVCSTPSGPCEKVGDGPVFATIDPVWGPGGEAVFRDHDGRTWLAYHAWTAPIATYDEGGARSLRIDPVVFEGSTLRIDGPSSSLRAVP